MLRESTSAEQKLLARSNEEYARDASGCLQRPGTHNAVVSAPGFYWGFTWGVSGFPGALDQER